MGQILISLHDNLYNADNNDESNLNFTDNSNKNENYHSIYFYPRWISENEYRNAFTDVIVYSDGMPPYEPSHGISVIAVSSFISFFFFSFFLFLNLQGSIGQKVKGSVALCALCGRRTSMHLQGMYKYLHRPCALERVNIHGWVRMSGLDAHARWRYLQRKRSRKCLPWRR